MSDHEGSNGMFIASPGQIDDQDGPYFARTR